MNEEKVSYIQSLDPWNILVLILCGFLGWVGIQLYISSHSDGRIQESMDALIDDHNILIKDVRRLREFMAETSSNRYRTSDAKNDFEIMDARIDKLVIKLDERLDSLTYQVIEIKNTMLTREDVPPPWVDDAIRENRRLIEKFHRGSPNFRE